ncbi:MAG: Glucosamine-6-phosphate deaminase 1 [Firmicutes bacterium ADurb.Bin182]|nr:MAG: Glucosamine-6-phosphate deaminase 1 [Firmicutes bacterium ADurb.Bin182]
MSILVFRDSNISCSAAATIIASQIIKKPNSVLGLSTGTAPEGVFVRLAGMTASGLLDWSDIKTFSTAEFLGFGSSNPDSCFGFLIKNLFSKVNINKSNVHSPDGTAEIPEEECRMYERRISDAGGIDLLLLCIGINGRLGFNEPAKEFTSSTHVSVFSQSAIEAHSKKFANKSEVPGGAITMGINTIMSAREIVLIANGAHKQDAVYKMLNEPVNPLVPASILQLHPSVTFVFDEAAADKL